jgi:hypothetical protein
MVPATRSRTFVAGTRLEAWLTMKVTLLATGSAMCAFGCLAGAGIGLIALSLAWESAIPIVMLAVLLGASAKFLDRSKMRALYGEVLGDLLHERDCPSRTCNDLAARDLLAFRGLRFPRSRCRLAFEMMCGRPTCGAAGVDSAASA